MSHGVTRDGWNFESRIRVLVFLFYKTVHGGQLHSFVDTIAQRFLFGVACLAHVIHGKLHSGI